MKNKSPQVEFDCEDAVELLVPGARANADLLFRIANELEKESDRGCALVSAAYLENEIAAILEGFFVKQGSKATEALFDFNGPVGTFSAKIKMAVALGLIPLEISVALDVLRRLRNDFAHLHEPLTFETARIKQRVENLLPSLPTTEQTTRQRFLMKIQSMAATIHLCSAMAVRRTASTFEPVPVCENASEQQIEIAARRLMKITAPDITYEQAVECVRGLRVMK